MRTLLIFLACAAGVAAQPLVSPEVRADRTVTFRLRAPNAQKVEVTLESLPKLTMTKGEGGVWTATSPPLEPDIYGYSFAVDGTGFVDPSNGQVKTNALSLSSAVLVPGEPARNWEQTNVAHGVVHHHFYESKLVGDRRDYYVYTPPGYDGKKKYPLLVLNHGYSDYADGWTTVGKANLILDNLIAKGEVKPLVVVMSLGYGVPVDLLKTGVPRSPEVWRNNASKWGEALLGEVLPAVELAYKVEKKREKRAIAGLSMGGGESLLIGLNHLETFAWIGAFSAGGGAGKPEEVYKSLSEKDNARIRLLWIACGKDDRLVTSNRQFVEWLKSKQIQHTWVETEGAHTWPVWRRYLAEFTKLLAW